MTTKSYAPVSAKFRAGPGGIHCRCCSAWRCSARKAKPLARRLARRVTKVALAKELAS